ncbi:MAG: DNA-protecting protein DprA [Treponema sp.]|nr:DNA-protecting protein DprA [Treponema sp.]
MHSLQQTDLLEKINKYGEKLPLMLALANISFLTAKEKKLMEDKLDNVAALGLMSIDDVCFLIGRVISKAKWLGEEYINYGNRSLALLKAYNINFVKFGEHDYPALLSEIYEPPYMLFFRGSLDCLTADCVAMVGTRRPTRGGMEAAYCLAKELAENGKTVISGMAIGIDTYAHKGALAVSGGKTVAVLASGLDNLYPSVNKRLASLIIQNGGALVSEYAPGEVSLPWHFPARNRIISGLSRGTVVVEAPARSGALITANDCIEQNRDLMFHAVAKEFDESELGKNINAKKTEKKAGWSCSNYINDGALIVENAQDVIQYIG